MDRRMRLLVGWVPAGRSNHPRGRMGHGRDDAIGDHVAAYFAAGDFAAGSFAAGEFAAGAFAVGMISIGFAAAGVFSIGVYAAGVFAFGGFAIGIFAFGPRAVGGFAFGPGAVSLARVPQRLRRAARRRRSMGEASGIAISQSVGVRVPLPGAGVSAGHASARGCGPSGRGVVDAGGDRHTRRDMAQSRR